MSSQEQPESIGVSLVMAVFKFGKSAAGMRDSEQKLTVILDRLHDLLKAKDLAMKDIPAQRKLDLLRAATKVLEEYAQRTNLYMASLTDTLDEYEAVVNESFS